MYTVEVKRIITLAFGLVFVLAACQPRTKDMPVVKKDHVTVAQMNEYCGSHIDSHVFQQSPFGLHAAGDSYNFAQDLNAHFIRKIVSWAEVEPRSKKYKFKDIDRHVNALQKAGLDLVITLHLVSRWGVDVDYEKLATEKPERSWTLFSGYPSHMDSWLTLVRKFVDRYDDDGKNDMPGLQRPIRYWQIENEVLWQWQGTPQQYLDMLAQTSRTIREADPQAKIILGGLTDGLALAKADRGVSTEGQRKVINVLEHVLREGAPYFDIIDFHSYDDEPYGLALQACWLREKMKKVGISKPIWSLENAGPFDDFTAARFAEHVVKRHIVGLAYGIDEFFWSSLNPTLGWSEQYLRLALLDRSRRKTPAYYSYKIMAHLLGSMKSLERLPSSAGISAFKATLPDRDVYIVWSDNGEQEWSLALQSDLVRVTHLITEPGTTQPRIDEIRTIKGVLTIPVTTSPLFVESVAR